MFQLVRIWARFIRKFNKEPLTGDQYLVRLYDRDVLVDDWLGDGKLKPDGSVEFTFDLAQASSFDSPLELYPDLYVVLTENGKEVFRSKVFWDVDFLKADPVTGERNKLTQDLGTFEV